MLRRDIIMGSKKWSLNGEDLKKLGLNTVFVSLAAGLTYLGAETAQIFMQIPKYTGQVFQGMILFFLLASDYLLFFKIKFLGMKKNEL